MAVYARMKTWPFFSCLLLAAFCQAQIPESVGMSSARLERAHQLLQSAVASRTVGSVIALIARDDKIVYSEAFGEAAPGVSMPKDAIVRLASITKPLTATAVMILFERGQLQLTDPVEKYLPEFAPAEGGGRSITIYDLLTHQAGPGEGPELDAVWEKAKTARGFSLLVSKLPRRFPPGTRFDYGSYGTAYEILGAIVERVSGRSFKDFLTDEVLSPLQMRDTYFVVPENKRSRLAVPYRNVEGKLVFASQQENDTDFYSGGGGLRSTVNDYYRFCLFLLHHGELGGIRLLSPKTVRLMMSEHVEMGPDDPAYAWGFGASVRSRRGGTDLETPCSYGWNGGTGTLFVVDPVEHLSIVIFVPSIPGTPGVDELRQAFVTAAYQGISKSYDHGY